MPFDHIFWGETIAYNIWAVPSKKEHLHFKGCRKTNDQWNWKSPQNISIQLSAVEVEGLLWAIDHQTQFRIIHKFQKGDQTITSQIIGTWMQERDLVVIGPQFRIDLKRNTDLMSRTFSWAECLFLRRFCVSLLNYYIHNDTLQNLPATVENQSENQPTFTDATGTEIPTTPAERTENHAAFQLRFGSTYSSGKSSFFTTPDGTTVLLPHFAIRGGISAVEQQTESFQTVFVLDTIAAQKGLVVAAQETGVPPPENVAEEFLPPVAAITCTFVEEFDTFYNVEIGDRLICLPKGAGVNFADDETLVSGQEYSVLLDEALAQSFGL